MNRCTHRCNEGRQCTCGVHQVDGGHDVRGEISFRVAAPKDRRPLRGALGAFAVVILAALLCAAGFPPHI